MPPTWPTSPRHKPYIQRLIEDAELRDNIRTAIESSQERV